MTSILGSLKLEAKGAEIEKFVGFAIPALAILISVAVVFFIVWPKFGEVTKLKETNVELTDKADKLDKKAGQLTSLDISKLTEQMTEAEQLLVSNKNVFSMLRQIETVSANSGSVISNLSVVPGSIGKTEAKTNTAGGAVPVAPVKDNTDPPDVSKISFSISIISDYRALLTFLSSLAAMPRINAIKDLSVGSQSDKGQVTSTFTIDSYWQELPTELPPIESPIVKITESQEAILSNVGINNATGSAIPKVPLGRIDLFAPF